MTSLVSTKNDDNSRCGYGEKERKLVAYVQKMENPIAWQGAMALVCGAFMYFSPQNVLKTFMNDQSDGVHWHLCRCLAAVIIAIGFTLWRWSASKQRAYHESLASMALTLAGVLSVASYTLNETLLVDGNIILKVMRYFALAVDLWIAFWTFSRCLQEIACWPQRKTTSSVDKWLLVDAIFCACYCLTWIASPTMLLKRQVKVTLNPSHVLISRFTVSLVFCTHLFSLKAMTFEDENDRRTWILGRALMCCLITAAQAYSLIMYTNWWTHYHYAGSGFFALWTLSAVWAAVRGLPNMSRED